MNKRGKIAILEILILLVATISFSYLIGQEIKNVNADVIGTVEDQEGNMVPLTPSSAETPVRSISELTKKSYKVVEGPELKSLLKKWNIADEKATILDLGEKNVYTGTENFRYLVESNGKINAIDVNGVGRTLSDKEVGLFNQGGQLQGGKIASASAGSGASAEGLGGFLKSLYTSTSGFGGVISTAAWGLTAYGIVKLAGGFLGFDQKKVDAASIALGFGFAAGRGAFVLAKNGFLGQTLAGSPVATGFIVGAVVAIGIYLLTYKTESQQTVTFECFPWEAPTGGANCEKCNADPYQPCSEYRCRSLGQACGIVNSGTDQEKCVWVNRKDVIAPIIKPWKDALLKGYEYRPDKAIQPPEDGVKVYNSESTTGCVQAFTPLRFGLETNEPSQCKIDYNKPLAGKNAVESQQIFDSMQFFMGGSNLFEYNHSEILSLPGPNAASNNSPILQNDGTYSLFVRCQDANGNANLQSYVFNFCVERGPDTTAPLIVTTNILNDSPIAYNKTSVDIELYVNEPSSCKWSTNDLAYKDMENVMSCSSSVFEMNANLLYKCNTKLTGLKNAQDNNFYFKCEDHPELPVNDRNPDTKSYAFTLIGTRTLNILTAKPNGTIKDATDIVPVTLEVETANGYKEGEALCYYSPTGTSDSYIEFRNTNSNLHSQVLNLPEGKYTYFIKCVDLGGNTDSTSVTFKVETDTSAPIIVRVFHEENKLKLITNENATCSYSLQNCNFNIVYGIQFRSIKGV